MSLSLQDKNILDDMYRFFLSSKARATLFFYHMHDLFNNEKSKVMKEI